MTHMMSIMFCITCLSDCKKTQTQKPMLYVTKVCTLLSGLSQKSYR